MIVWEEWITREIVQRHPDYIFVFGDNVARQGFGGQAAAMRGAPNSLGVRTKELPSNSFGSFFSDLKFDHYKAIIDADLQKVEDFLKAGKTVVIPMDGLGSGRAKMKEKAPKLFQYLNDRLAYLEDTYGSKPLEVL